MYQIIDWAGNLKFNGVTFSSFENAWEYLYEQFPEENDLQEFEVISTRERTCVK